MTEAIDFTVALKGLDGKTDMFQNVMSDQMGQPRRNEDGTLLTEVITLGKIVTNSLCAGGQNISGEEHVKRFLLATKIREQQTVILGTAEIELIKQCIQKTYPATLIVAQCWLLLDPALSPETHIKSKIKTV
jgi:hypothetical protein